MFEIDAIEEPPGSNTLPPAGIFAWDEKAPELSHDNLFYLNGVSENFDKIGIHQEREWQLCTSNSEQAAHDGAAAQMSSDYRHWSKESAGTKRSLREALDIAQCSLTTAKKHRTVAVAGASEPGCISFCQPSLSASVHGLLGGPVAASLSAWVASHEQAPSTGRVLMPPSNLKAQDAACAMRDTLLEVMKRRIAQHHALRAIQQLGLWFPGTAQTAVAAGLVAALMSALSPAALEGMTDGHVPAAADQVDVEAAKAKVCTGHIDSWHWLVALAGQLLTSGLADNETLASMLSAKLHSIHPLLASVCSLCLPVLRVLMRHRRASQTTSRSCASLLMLFIRTSGGELDSAAYCKESGVFEPNTFASAIRTFSSCMPGTAKHAAVSACCESLFLLGDMLLANSDLFSCSQDLHPAITLMGSKLLLDAVGQFAGQLDWAKRVLNGATTAFQHYTEAAASTAMRLNIPLAAVTVMESTLPDACRAASALWHQQAERRVPVINASADIVRWICDWACGALYTEHETGIEQGQSSMPKLRALDDSFMRSISAIQMLCHLRCHILPENIGGVEGSTTGSAIESEDYMQPEKQFQNALCSWLLQPSCCSEVSEGRLSSTASQFLCILAQSGLATLGSPVYTPMLVHLAKQCPKHSWLKGFASEWMPQLELCSQGSAMAAACLLSKAPDCGGLPGSKKEQQPSSALVTLQAWWQQCQRHGYSTHISWLASMHELRQHEKWKHVAAGDLVDDRSCSFEGGEASSPKRPLGKGGSADADPASASHCRLSSLQGRRSSMQALPLGKCIKRAAKHLQRIFGQAFDPDSKNTLACLQACSRLRFWQAQVLLQWLLTYAASVAPTALIRAALCGVASTPMRALLSFRAIEVNCTSAGSVGVDVAQLENLLSTNVGALDGSASAQCSSAAVAWLLRLLAFARALQGGVFSAAIVSAIVCRSRRSGTVSPAWLSFVAGSVRAVQPTLRSLGWAYPVAEALCMCCQSSSEHSEGQCAILADVVSELLGKDANLMEQLISVLKASSLPASHLLLAALLLRADGARLEAMIAFHNALSAAPLHEELKALGNSSDALMVSAHLSANITSHSIGAVALAPAASAVVAACVACTAMIAADVASGVDHRLIALLSGLQDWWLRRPGRLTAALPPQLQVTIAISHATMGHVQKARSVDVAECVARTVAHSSVVLQVACTLGLLHLPSAVHYVASVGTWPTETRMLVLRALLTESANTYVPAASVQTGAFYLQLKPASWQQILSIPVGHRTMLQASLDPTETIEDIAAIALFDTCLHGRAVRWTLQLALPQMESAVFRQEMEGRTGKSPVEIALVLSTLSGQRFSVSECAAIDSQSLLASCIPLFGLAQHKLAAYVASVLVVRRGMRTVATHASLAPGCAEQVAQALVGGMLMSPSCTPLVAAVAVALGEPVCRALLTVLLLGLHSRTASAAASQVKLCGRSLFVDLRDALPRKLRAGDERVPPVAELQGAYIDLHLQMLCRMDHMLWRERTEALVGQLEVQAEEVSVCSGRHGLRTLGCAQNLGLPDRSAAADGLPCAPVMRWPELRATLWLRLQLLMPLLPIVYNDKATFPNRNLRHRMALVCIKLVAGSQVLELDGDAGHISTIRLMDRIFLLLHTLMADEWAAYVTCHNDRGRPQPVGPILDQPRLSGIAAGMKLPQSKYLRLNAALLQDCPPVLCNMATRVGVLHGASHSAEKADSMTGDILEVWHCGPGLIDVELWNASEGAFERVGSHTVLAGAPRSPKVPARFHGLAQ